MIPSAFAYHAPTTLAEALSLLQQYGDEARVLAGGHSLLPAMKLRLAAPAALIDIGRIAELRGIVINGSITIGATTTWSAIEQHVGLKRLLPVLPEAVRQIGDIQVRNRGTLGGALAHADPAADAPAVVVALDAELRVQGPGGARSIAAGDFFLDLFTTALAPGELLTGVVLQPLDVGAGAAYIKFPHPASRYAIVGVATYVKLQAGVVSACRVAVTGAGPFVTRQPAVEQALVGSDGSSEAVAAAVAQAGEDMDILGDLHASEAYRRAMVKVFTRRALTQALARARA